MFTSGDAKGLFNSLLDVFSAADLVAGNLEFPLTDAGKGIVKCGPVLKGKKECIRLLQNAGFDVVGLANNHIRDCGDEGVLSTLECSRNAGMLTVGAGRDAAEAATPLVVDVAGWKIGILAFAEHEFNAAGPDWAGANLFDPYESFDAIKELRTQCDYMTVLYHGGIEYYAYPSPLLQKKCRKLADAGADLILCQHSHCVGTAESRGNATILYGQGNTLFGCRRNLPDWNAGLIVKVSLLKHDRTKTAIEYLPVYAVGSGIDLMPPEKAESLLNAFSERSQKIMDKNFVTASWQAFCESQEAHYFPLLFGLGRIPTFLNRRMKNKMIELLFSKKQMRTTMNLIRCEAHNEVVQTMLDGQTKDDDA